MLVTLGLPEGLHPEGAPCPPSAPNSVTLLWAAELNIPEGDKAGISGEHGKLQDREGQGIMLSRGQGFFCFVLF